MEGYLKTWEAMRRIRVGRHYIAQILDRTGTIAARLSLIVMEDARIDRLEVRFDELAAEMRRSLAGIDTRLCKIEARVEQCATKVEVGELRSEMYKMSSELKTWMLATMVTIIATSLAATFGLHHWGS
ncbi:hypothetical protein CR105_04785 [Massilia eurypsychrophila]|uniref:DUF1640 domain-containing protein n=2 Tax=Massilia eurypsychrophila TaxID=1485217 RepID=A0A2G8TK13_9BURK|nr:hypothetical protein CR105_04785 [Massilia eurypsychrophila]